LGYHWAQPISRGAPPPQGVSEMRRWLQIWLYVLLAMTLTACATAATDTDLMPATVAYVVDEREVELLGEAQVVQTLELAIGAGPRKGEIVIVEHGAIPSVYVPRYRAGDRVYLRAHVSPDGSTVYEIAVRDRTFPLGWMTILFVGLVVLAGGQRGARSLLGLALSFVVIFFFVLPRVAAGQQPVWTALLGCGAAMPVSYYLSHGLGRKTTVALVGSLLALGLTSVIAVAFVAGGRLSGFSGDEAGFVGALYGGAIDMRGLLLGGMIIGVLGVLDDVTVAQAATVEQLREANPRLDTWELYRRAMHVGQDHIASMVNTLVLVYAGAALPLLLLLTDQSLPVGYVLSQELVAEEVVRMLVTSSGLVAAVPVTTLLAARWMAPGGGSTVSAEQENAEEEAAT
jgi:uncharacterized membrane protein